MKGLLMRSLSDFSDIPALSKAFSIISKCSDDPGLILETSAALSLAALMSSASNFCFGASFSAVYC